MPGPGQQDAGPGLRLSHEGQDFRPGLVGLDGLPVGCRLEPRALHHGFERGARGSHRAGLQEDPLAQQVEDPSLAPGHDSQLTSN